MDIREILLTLCTVYVHLPYSEAITSTGGFGVLTDGTIQTPNYPSNYAANLNRIWVLEAPTGSGVELEIGPVTGQTDGSGGCVDYLEVRDGCKDCNQLFIGCSTTANTTVTSTLRWLWIRFYANWEQQYSGFSATWTHFVRTDNLTETTPRPRCRGNEIRCPNTECVTMSWRCDGFNDCGFDGTGSDEDWWCFTVGMTVGIKMAYGVSIGVVVFILLILLIAWLDGQFASCGGRCARGPRSCLGLDRLRQGPRTRRLPDYQGQTPAMLLLTGQHDKFEELAAKEWEKKTDMYNKQRRASAISMAEALADAQRDEPTPEPESPMTKPKAVQRKGQDKLQRMKSAREQVPQVKLTRSEKRTQRDKPWTQGAKKTPTPTPSPSPTNKMHDSARKTEMTGN